MFLRSYQSILCFFFFRFCYFLVTRHLCLETHHFSNHFNRCKRINKTTFLILHSSSSVSFFCFSASSFFLFHVHRSKIFFPVIPFNIGTTALANIGPKKTATPLCLLVIFLLVNCLFFLVFPPKSRLPFLILGVVIYFLNSLFQFSHT